MRIPCIETIVEASAKDQWSFMTGYWTRPYQSMALIPVAANIIERERREMFRRPMPEMESEMAERRVERNLVTALPNCGFGSSSWVVVDVVPSSVSGDLVLLSCNVSGHRNIAMNAVSTDIPKLTARLTCGVPPLPSRFMSHAPMNGQNV